MLLLGGEEFRKQVWGGGGGGFGGIGGGNAFLKPGAREARYGEGGVYEAVLRGEKIEGVFEEEHVEEGDLPDGSDVAEQFAEVGDYALDVLVALEEAVAL